MPSPDTEISNAWKAKSVFISGALDSWAVTLEENPEMLKFVIKDMKELAESLRNSGGVVILRNEE